MGVTRNYNEVKNNLKERGIILDVPEEEFNGVTLTKLHCHNDEGYKFIVIYDNIMRGQSVRVFDHRNPYAKENMNLLLDRSNMPFECTGDVNVNDKTPIKFRCKRCGEIMYYPWDKMRAICKKEFKSHKICPNCDCHKESLHSSVLKQMFLHEHPDTSVENKSFRNERTGKICPTDIVNHRLKIAIEVQSEWHDKDETCMKDAEKMLYWINRGYSFYSPDIRDFSVLEMCQLFFKIDKIPPYINMTYSDVIDARSVQLLLDRGYNVVEIEYLGVCKRHQVYDAVKSGKVYYPKNYIRPDYTPVIQFDMQWNPIGEYNTIKEAAISNGLNEKNISGALRSKSNKYGGFYWKKKKSLY